MASRLNTKDKLKSILKVSSAATAIFTGMCLYKGDEKFYSEIAIPLVHIVDPETAHNLAITTLKWGLVPKVKSADSMSLANNVWGMQFKNPIGIAAGFDKQGEAVEGLHKIGFSFVEIGSVTPKPQPGNPKPRVFRLVEDNAVVNRYGFNSEGHEVVWNRLRALRNSNAFRGIVGVNLGKNKSSEDAAKDYIDGIKKFSDVADYFVINISSPNTPGLRNLQSKKHLQDLLIKVNETRQAIECRQPLLLKLAPDLTEEERQDIVDVVLSEKSKVDGLILCNTTITRNNLTSPQKVETGGLSGAPLTDLSTTLIADMYRRTHGSIPIIGVGGVFCGADAYKKIRAGASLIQIYTSYIYHGPPVVGKIKRELKEILERDGIVSIKDAVGKDTTGKR